MNRQVTLRQRLCALSLAAVVGLGSTACSGIGAPQWREADKPKGPQITATITGPAAVAKDVPASAEITFRTENASTATVEMKDAAGKVVSGELLPGGTTWRPENQLEYGTAYTATVTATGAEGKTATGTGTFTTMAKPANQVRISTNIGDDMVVGVGMMLVLRFGRDIPENLRASVQKRLLVRSTPAQEGTWHWFSATEVHFRPKAFWTANTKLSFRILTGGVPMGGDWYGRSDLSVVATVGPALVMTVDNRTKQMTVTKDGKVIKTIPVSLGKPATPSSSGTMVVMEKLRKTVFDTTADPNPANRYKINIEYAQRLTWGGEYVHAAPWSESVQGRSNVSHGCVNVSMGNATWLFANTKIGDPITVKGTERKLEYANGWTDWNMSWDEFIKGSAIPYVAPTVEPSPVAPSGQPSTGPTTNASPGN